jgi:nuclear-control-of-ATPase protein 2
VNYKLEILERLEIIFLFSTGALNYLVSLSKLESIHDLHVFTGHLLRLCADFHENVHGMRTPWFTIDLLSQLDNDTLKLARIFSLAEIQFENSSRFESELAPIWDRVKIPSAYSRNWLYIAIGVVTVWGVSAYVNTHTDKVADFFLNVKLAAHSFYDNQVKGVLKGIWETIRYEEDEEILRLKQRAVKASEDSLGRMVVQFNLEKQPPLSPENLEKIRIAASQGDLSTIMPSYEQEIENPIRNALFSEFIRLALIQVQKQKVDIEKAMLQIDKLLRANELNFKILAAAPTVILAVLLVGFIMREKIPRHIHNELRSTLRKTHSLLTHYKGEELTAASTDSDEERQPLMVGGVEIGLDCVSYGRILLSLHRLSKLAEGLAPKHKKWFRDDLRQIETESFSVDQRILTINRMYNTYPFLALH